ncbi:MAG: GNAT family N-acetyltransferase [Lewinellaceae bacterium]|nr:GNAT family N-acetyltransferase [Lewinellaceae bacterium]
MINLVRTDSFDPAFVALVKHLDAELAERDGEDHPFYAQFNKIDRIRHVVLAFMEDVPVGCGAIKEYDGHTAEVKRMYVLPGHRKTGIATGILSELERWAAELSYTHCILETGIHQPEAIELYKRRGYRIIPNYGQYADVANSICFTKGLNQDAS